MWRSIRGASWLFVALALSRPALAADGEVHLGIKVIHAHHGPAKIDPKLQALVQEFKGLKFSAYDLKDEAVFNLEVGSSGRMQLPTEAWMTVRPREIAADGKLRLEMEVEKIKFKITVSIAPGATLAVGGPPYAEGALILAVTRDPKPSPAP